jgi:hypothetical protein
MWIIVVVALLVGLGGVIVLTYRGAMKASARANEFVLAFKAIRPDPLPRTISVIPAPGADWDCPSVRRIAEPLIAKGFERAGVFSIAEFNGLESYYLLHRDKWCYAIISRLVAPDIVFYELDAHVKDGPDIELSSSPLLKGTPERPGVIKKSVVDWNPESSLNLFMAMCAGRTMREVVPEELPERLRSQWESSLARREAVSESG